MAAGRSAADLISDWRGETNGYLNDPGVGVPDGAMNDRWRDVVLLRRLTRRHRLVLAYAGGVVAVVAFYTIVYNVGMRTFESRPQSIFHSFQTVVETLTTTGYGADSPWETPAMNVLVVAMQVTGIGI
jgi:hypothetical protein